MSLVIFSIGVLVFLITVYGTVVAGGLNLTARQLRDDRNLSAKAGIDGDNPDLDFKSPDVVAADF